VLIFNVTKSSKGVPEPLTAVVYGIEAHRWKKDTFDGKSVQEK